MNKDRLDQLKARAESASASAQQVLDDDYSRALIHELQVYQEELEVQKQELEEKQISIEAIAGKFSKLFDLSPVGYILLDRHQEVVEANIQARLLLQMPTRSKFPKRISSFITYSNSISSFMRWINLDDKTHIDLRVSTDPEIWVNLRKTPFGENTTTLLLSVVDISERKLRESELEESNRRLQLSMHALDSFAYSVNHNLSTPLRAFHGYSSLLSEQYADTLDAEALDYLQRIRDASKAMEGTISAMLELTQISRNPPKRQTFDFTALARDVIGTEQAKRPGTIIESSVSNNMTLNADLHLTRKTLETLVDNAIKFSRDKPLCHIEIGKTVKDSLEVFFIRDQGAGYDSAYSGKLFKPFQRLHSNNEFDGMGVGLALVKRIIEIHNGKIFAQSELGVGTTIYFSFNKTEPLV